MNEWVETESKIVHIHQRELTTTAKSGRDTTDVFPYLSETSIMEICGSLKLPEKEIYRQGGCDFLFYLTEINAERQFIFNNV